jgi:hypothetical protein
VLTALDDGDLRKVLFLWRFAVHDYSDLADWSLLDAEIGQAARWYILIPAIRPCEVLPLPVDRTCVEACGIV